MAGRLAAMRHSLAATSVKLVDSVPREVVDDIFHCALKKQTGVTLRSAAACCHHWEGPSKLQTDPSACSCLCRVAAIVLAAVPCALPCNAGTFDAMGRCTRCWQRGVHLSQAHAGLWSQPHRAATAAVCAILESGAADPTRAPRGGAGEPALRPQRKAPRPEGRWFE